MRSINYERASKHSVDIGYFEKGVFISKYSVGETNRKARQGFFKMNLDMFPYAEYYIVKSDLSDEDYTVFSLREETEDGYDFKRVIGNATLEEDAHGQQFLKMWLFLLKTELVMTCAPLSDECSCKMMDEENVLEFKQLKCA